MGIGGIKMKDAELKIENNEIHVYPKQIIKKYKVGDIVKITFKQEDQEETIVRTGRIYYVGDRGVSIDWSCQFHSRTIDIIYDDIICIDTYR